MRVYRYVPTKAKPIKQKLKCGCIIQPKIPLKPVQPAIYFKILRYIYFGAN